MIKPDLCVITQIAFLLTIQELLMNRKKPLCLLMICLTLPACSADVYPGKERFAEPEKWPATTPAEVTLKNFQPFRAVYERQYKQASGTDKGALRTDRVIISAEPVGWDGQDAVQITLIDSGVVASPDTNARVLSMTVTQQGLSPVLEIGPIPGKAKDYYVVSFMAQQANKAMVMTTSNEVSSDSEQLNGPGFGPGSWAMANMPLQAGMKINLQPYYSPQANVLATKFYAIVTGQEMMTDLSGQQHQAWVLESSDYFSLASPKMRKMYLTDRPPYYLGSYTVNLETGETTPYVVLRDVTLLQ